VVIPLFLDRLANETLEKALARTEFGDVASVLNAIEEVDEEIVETISELMQSKGRGAKFNPQPLADKITVLGPTIDLTTLQTNIFIEIVETLGSVWDKMYGRLVAYYKDVNGLHTKDRALGSWIAEQRRKKSRGLLSAERIEKLDQIGFNWIGEDILKTAWGHKQETFENLTLSVLRSVGRPMRSDELIEQFKKRGHPIPGNEVRTAWNRLWTARNKGILTNYPKLGYWIAREPLSEEAKQDAAIAARARPKRHGPSLRVLTRGRKKGPPRALTQKDVRRAEELLLAGKSRLELVSILGVSLPTLRKYIPGGISGLKARYPNVVIPKRPYVSRPRRPDAKRGGRPSVITLDQVQQAIDMRAQGETLSAIAALMGVKRSTIYGHLRKAAAKKQNADGDGDSAANEGQSLAMPPDIQTGRGG
jgi:DNA invertase Pin-like site-specific DNA recombinase